MILADSPLLLSGSALLFLGNLAVISVFLAALGRFVVSWGGRRSLPFQHGVLVAILGLSLLSPALLAASATWGLGVFRLPVPADPGGEELPGAADEASQVVPHRLRTTAGQIAATDAARAAALLPWWAIAGTMLAGVWAGGTAATGLRVLRAFEATLRFRRGLRTTDDAELQEAAVQALRSLGCGRNVVVCETPHVVAPFSMGWLRPLIVLPEGLAAELDTEQLRLVLLHESAHVCRHDHAVVLLQAVASTLFWWNPFLQTIHRLLAAQREQLCDDLAAGQGQSRRRLAVLLLHLAEWSVGRRQEILGAAGMVDDGPDELGGRIERLLRPNGQSGARLGVSALASLAALMGLGTATLVLCTPQSASAPPASVESAETPNYYYQTDPVKHDGLDTDLLAGHWLMSLPAGYQHRITLTPVGPNRYRLGPDVLNSSGIYELRGQRLVLAEPTKCHLPGFEWELRGADRLVLVAQPPVPRIGSNYQGAYLSR